MIGPVFENGMASRTQAVSRKHSSLGPKKNMAEDGFRIQISDRKRHRWTEWIENRGWNNRRSRRKLFGG